MTSNGDLLDELDELDPAQTLDAVTALTRERRAAEVAEMRLAAHWAALHGESRHERDPMTQPGGDGTPEVREYALPELAMARETHPATTRNLLADALDLQHRLPRVWAQVLELSCEPWVARKVAAMSRNLDADRMPIVDRAVARVISGHSVAPVLDVARAKIIEADPERHAQARELHRHRRFVTLSRSDEHGYRCIIAKVTAGDAAWIDALVDRVADILTAQHGHDHNRDELRSLALGWLARPADLLRLLLEHSDCADEPVDESGAEQAPEPEPDGRRSAWAPDHLQDTLGRLAALSTRQLAALRGKGTVFVHIDAERLLRQCGIARVEGQGPMLVQALAELLGHADVRLRPVIDLNKEARVDRYEHPEVIKDISWLRAGGDVFPYSTIATRDRVDFDHVDPYDPNGPPGQTGTHNSGPLRRRHHRWKTWGGYRVRQAGGGRLLWQAPHGTCVLRDHTGDHLLDRTQAELMLTSPPGLDLYFARVDIDLDGDPRLEAQPAAR